MEAAGRWSMLDVFVVALIVVGVRTSLIDDVSVHAGVYVFGRHRPVAVGGAAHDGAGPTGAHRRGRLSPPATPPSGFMNP
jgi:hypothetical protein